MWMQRIGLEEHRKCTLGQYFTQISQTASSEVEISYNVYEYKFHICVAEELIKGVSSLSSVYLQLPVVCVDLTGENILSSQPKEIKWKHYSVQSKH